MVIDFSLIELEHWDIFDETKFINDRRDGVMMTQRSNINN